MRKYESRKRITGFPKNRITHQGDAVRSFMLITVCAFAAVIIAIGSKVLDNSENGKVYAAESISDKEQDSLPTGIAGVVTGMDTASTEKSINRIGTSCEEVMVGQRVRKVDDSVTDFDISSSMESRVNEFDEKALRLPHQRLCQMQIMIHFCVLWRQKQEQKM